jgi:hypothetical protein
VHPLLQQWFKEPFLGQYSKLLYPEDPEEKLAKRTNNKDE